MASGCRDASASRLGMAFACVIGAAVASIAGGLLVIAMPVRSNLFLAASLAFAAGVMLYISLVDIYVDNAVKRFADAGYSNAYAFMYATICFFCGFPISWLLDKFSERLAYHGCPHSSHPTVPASAPELPEKPQREENGSLSAAGLTPQRTGADVESGSSENSGQQASPLASERASVPAHSQKLVHMGILAALAVAIHNMPEGLVTFVGYMDSIQSGITTAVAITIHNIPEGMVVASAVYFGTGRRLQAILWASVAALTEPLGGLIGLAVVCGGSMTNTVFGILFGLVGGIMTYISIKELLPGARDFDPEDRVTTSFLTGGMIIMACSLIAISFSTTPKTVAATAAAAAP